MNYYELTSEANQEEFNNMVYAKDNDSFEKTSTSFIQNLDESSLNAVGDFLSEFIEEYCDDFKAWGKIFIPLYNNTPTSKIIFSTRAFYTFLSYYRYAVYENKKTEFTMYEAKEGEPENEDLIFNEMSYIKQDFDIKMFGACEYIEIDTKDILRKLGYISQKDDFVKAFCYQFHKSKLKKMEFKKLNEYAKENDDKLAHENSNRTFCIMLLGGVPYVLNAALFPSNSQLLPIIFLAFSILSGVFYGFYSDIYSFKNALRAMAFNSTKFKICFNAFKYLKYVWAALGLILTSYLLWGLFI